MRVATTAFSTPVFLSIVSLLLVINNGQRTTAVTRTRIPALGRWADLGSIYNPNTGKFSGHSIFQFSGPLKTYLKDQHPNFLTVKEEPLHTSEFKMLSTLQDKFDLIGMTPSIAASYLVGRLEHTMGPIKGSLKFLEDEPQTSSDFMLAGSLLHRIKTRKEKVNVENRRNHRLIQHYGNWDVIRNLDLDLKPEGKQPLQLVVGVEWGSDTTVNAFRPVEYADVEGVNGQSKLTQMRNHMSMMLYRLAFDRNPGPESDSDSAHNLDNSQYSNYSLNIFRDLTKSPRLNLTFDRARVILNRLPETIQQVNRGKGLPMAFTLYPLEELINNIQGTIKVKWMNQDSQGQGQVKNRHVSSSNKLTLPPDMENVPEAYLQQVITLFDRANSLHWSIESLSREMRSDHGDDYLNNDIFKMIDLLRRDLKDQRLHFKNKLESSSNRPGGEREWGEILRKFGAILQQLQQRTGSDLVQNSRRKREIYKMFQGSTGQKVKYLGRKSRSAGKTLDKHLSRDKVTYVLLYNSSLERRENDDHEDKVKVKTHRKGQTRVSSRNFWKRNLQLFFQTLDKPWNSLLLLDCDFYPGECERMERTTVRQYLKGSLTTSDCLSRMSIEVKGLLRIRQLALGRRPKIGDLFDSRTESFVGKSIFMDSGSGSRSGRNVNVSSTLTLKTSLKSVVPIPKGHTLADKLKALKIKDGDVHLSMLTHLFPLENSGLFFHPDTCLKSREQRDLTKSVMVTFTTGRALLDYNKVNSNPNTMLDIARLTDPKRTMTGSSNPGFTHYVKEIELGHTSFVSMLSQNRKNPGQPQGQGQGEESDDVGPDNQFEHTFWTDIVNKDFSNLQQAMENFPNRSEYVSNLSFSGSNFVLFSDLLPKKFQKLRSIRQVFDKMTETVKMGKVVPVAFYLEPIESLQQPFGLITAQQKFHRFSDNEEDLKVISEAGRIVEAIRQIENDIVILREDLLKHKLCFKVTEYERHLDKLERIETAFEEESSVFLRELMLKSIAVKSSRGQIREIKKLAENFVKDDKFYPNYKLRAMDVMGSVQRKVKTCIEEGM